MTDEKLIEEAAKAMYFEDCGVAALADDAEPFREMARIALAVFEKAHTPTDDEREALYLIEQAASFREQTSADVDDFPNSMVGLWLRTASALESALRRTGVPEPSAGVFDELAKDVERFRDPDESEPSTEPRHFAPYGSTNALCDETVPRRVAWDETTGEYADQRFTVKRDDTTCPECRWRMGLGPESQGEPSDAQVKAFTDAEWGHRFMVFNGGWSCKCGWSLPGPKLTLDAAEKEHRGHQIRASLKATLGMRVARNEPSDGQVEAAGALLYGISWGTDLADPDLIRDALRAARDA